MADDFEQLIKKVQSAKADSENVSKIKNDSGEKAEIILKDADSRNKKIHDAFEEHKNVSTLPGLENESQGPVDSTSDSNSGSN